LCILVCKNTWPKIHITWL